MRFGRTIAYLLGLVLILSGALILTNVLRPKAPLLRGDRLFPVAVENITEIHWEVSLSTGERAPLVLHREGEFWRMQSPYAGALCDTAAVTQFLDTCQALRVQSRLSREHPDTFEEDATLTLRTTDASYSYAFGPTSPMELSQRLVNTGHEIVAVNADAVNTLPQSADDLRTHALLPFTADRILSMEWRTPGRPFARALRMSNGNWNVTRPFAFEAKASDVNPALALLTMQRLITTYILPTAPTTEATPRLTSEVELAQYGLDEESAIRVTIHLQGVSSAWTLRFGKPIPEHPTNIYCLLDGYQAIVSAPATVRSLFEATGPFATDFRNLPILSDFNNRIQSVTIRRNAPEATIRFAQSQGVWQLLAPMTLPADNARINALLSALTALPGDLVGAEEPEHLDIICELALQPFDTTQPPTHLVLYQESPTVLYAYRSDLSRLYRIHFSVLPNELLAPDLERILVDRTIFSLPADAIRRIAIAQRDGTTHAVVRSTVTDVPWVTELPRGAYLCEKTVDAWLTRFADFKATDVLRDLPSGPEALHPYGLDAPLLTLTLDLRGDNDALRRILLVGTPDEKRGVAPALIQGRPILYEIDINDLRLLQQPLVK